MIFVTLNKSGECRKGREEDEKKKGNLCVLFFKSNLPIGLCRMKQREEGRRKRREEEKKRKRGRRVLLAEPIGRPAFR